MPEILSEILSIAVIFMALVLVAIYYYQKGKAVQKLEILRWANRYLGLIQKEETKAPEKATKAEMEKFKVHEKITQLVQLGEMKALSELVKEL